MIDKLQELCVQLGGKIREQNLYDWNYNLTSHRELIVKNYKGFKIEIGDFGDFNELSIKVESDFSFSINLPNKIFGYNTSSEIKDFPYNVYFETDNVASNTLIDSNFQAFFSALTRIIKVLKLTRNEGLFYYNNAINFFLDKSRDLVLVLDHLVNAIKEHPSIFAVREKQRIFSKNIPVKLRPLIPLLKKFSVSDDSERDQLIEDINAKQKKRLVDTVNVHMVDINQFLDSFGDKPLNYEATLLGNLAELVTELKMML